MKRIAALVLAAGRSTRMAPANKLLADIDGRSLVALVVDAALASNLRPVIVVIGHDAARIRAALGTRPVRIVENPGHADGMATSIRAGIAALDDDTEGALFMLADMPRVGPVHLDRLIDAFNPAEGRAICVPTHGARRGNPVLWAKRFFPEMIGLTGDVGARGLLAAHAEDICEVDMTDDGILTDVDTPAALAALRAHSF